MGAVDSGLGRAVALQRRARAPMMVLIDYCVESRRGRVSLGKIQCCMVTMGRLARRWMPKGGPVRNLRDCAERLHSAHLVYGKVVYSGGDVEVHRGQGGRLYVFDATRCFL